MAGVRGYYGLIQYCPDASRAEAANVGVLLYCPDLKFIEALTDSDNRRVKRFFKERELDLGRINAAKQAIEARLKATAGDFRSVEDLNQFIATRANELKVTPLRPMKVQDPEADLDALFRELVGGAPDKESEKSACPELDAYFRRLFQARRARLDLSVKVPVLERTLRIPYSYQNGRLNLIRPQLFSESNTAIRLAIEGDLLQRHRLDATERRLIIVSSFSPQLDGRVIGRVKGILGEYKIREVAQERVPEFVQEIEKEAHPLDA